MCLQKEAWVSGARLWTDDQREAFANEYACLLPQGRQSS